MQKKETTDLIIALFLVLGGALILIFPIFKIINLKYIFIAVLSFYGVINAIQFILTSKDKDYESLFTVLASIITLIIIGFIDIENSPMNLALVLFIWIIFMSLIKLKKCDYYHDRNKRIWMLKVVTMILFILSGLLTVLNLYYEPEVQIIVLGFFYFIHGILELVDPITNYLLNNK